MAGIALLLPDALLCRQAEEIIKRKKHHVVYIKETTIDTVVLEARNAIAKGANIVISRGSQASAVKQHTNVPVVEIELTAQELGMSIVKAKKILKKKKPVIGIFFWKGMLCDTSNFEELFDVKIIRRDLNNDRAWVEVVEEAIVRGMDFLISGEQCVNYANQKGIPAMLFRTTGEALQVALNNAEKMYYTSQVEQQSYAQFISVLDSAFNGIIKTDADGSVLLMNRMMEQLLKASSEELLGRHITEVLEGLDQDSFGQVLNGSMDSYSTFINTNYQALVVVVEPIAVDGVITGTIVSCNMMKRLNWDREENMREQFLRGFVAKGSLDELAVRMPSLKNVVDLAKLYAQSASPILVEGKTAQELEDLCQGIHNYSLRRNGPFLVVNVAGIREDDQMKILFGEGEDKGLLMQANYGTIVIRAIDKLTLNAQYHLLQAIRKKRRISSIVDNDNVQELDVRIIGCTSKKLVELKRNGKMRKDLYYLLQTFRLTVPEFSERKEDVRILVEEYVKKYMDLYSRFHILTDEARDVIVNYYWEGNDLQLEAFCERLILTTRRRKITADYVNYLLDDLYNMRDKDEFEEQPIGELLTGELENLKAALEKYGGNRILTAKALNISTSTLWRRMKKYNLD
ncbi:MAG: PrpR N-terminal domain-containing protein [Clostridiaceae bacterium]|nr:PrpR N-terminal domain-containing protein [Clostridiaceae bacterium]